MTIKDIEAMEAQIQKASDEGARAQGAQDQLLAQVEKEFGVKTIEEAKALLVQAEADVLSLSRKVETDGALLQADLALALAPEVGA